MNLVLSKELPNDPEAIPLFPEELLGDPEYLNDVVPHLPVIHDESTGVSFIAFDRDLDKFKKANGGRIGSQVYKGIGLLTVQVPPQDWYIREEFDATLLLEREQEKLWIPTGFSENAKNDKPFYGFRFSRVFWWIYGARYIDEAGKAKLFPSECPTEIADKLHKFAIKGSRTKLAEHYATQVS